MLECLTIVEHVIHSGRTFDSFAALTCFKSHMLITLFGPLGAPVFAQLFRQVTEGNRGILLCLKLRQALMVLPAQAHYRDLSRSLFPVHRIAAGRQKTRGCLQGFCTYWS